MNQKGDDLEYKWVINKLKKQTNWKHALTLKKTR